MPEFIVFLNLSVIFLGLLLWIINKNKLLIKLLLTLPLFGFHFIVIPIILSGCSFGWFNGRFCGESAFLLFLIPPYQIAYGVIIIFIILMFKTYLKIKPILKQIMAK